MTTEGRDRHEPQTVAALQREVETLRRRVAELEASRESGDSTGLCRECGRMSAPRGVGEADLLEMASTIRDVFWIFDWREQRVLYASPAYEEIWGRSVQSLYDRYEDWSDALHPDDREQAQASFAQVIETGGGQPRQYRVVHPDGTVRWISDRAYPVRDADGEVCRVVGVAEDITDHYLAEQEVRAGQVRLLAAVESLPFGFFMLDNDGRYVLVNSACRGDWGNVEGKRPEDLDVDPETLALWQDNNRRALAGEVVRGQVELAPHGVKRHYYNIVSPIRDGDQIQGILGLNIDITPRVQAEESLRESEARLHAAVENLPFEFFVLDEEGRYVMQNSGSRENWGDFLGRRPEDMDLDEAALALWQENRRRVLAGETVQGETVLEPHGAKVYYQYVIAPILEGNEVRGMLGLSIDVTARREAQEGLKESEEKFRSLAEQAPSMIFINQAGRVVYVNPRCEECMGYAKEEFYAPGFNFLELIVPEHRDRVMANFREHAAGRDVPPIEYALQTRDGCRIDVILATKLIRYGGRPAILGTVTDITERKRAEEALKEAKRELEHRVRGRTAELEASNEHLEAEIDRRRQVERELRESEKKYRTLVESAGDAIATVSEDGTILFVNTTVARQFGVTPEAMIGRHMKDFFPESFAGVQVSRIREVVANGKGVNLTSPARVGGRARWFNATFEPLELGRTNAVLIIARDIDDLVQARRQLEEYRDQMTRADRLASLGTMSAMVAHELTQPLTVVRLSLQNALEALRIGSEASVVQEDLDGTLDEIATMTEIIERFRGFARASSPGHRCDVDLSEIAAHMIGLTAEAAQRARVAVTHCGLATLPPFSARPKDMEQLFFALLMNAIQAADGQTERRVVVTGRTLDQKIELDFEDNCGGIAAENVERILKPFFTTKADAGGTGLGLCVVEHILDRYDGEIEILNRPGEGVTFKIVLPLSAPGS